MRSLHSHQEELLEALDLLNRMDWFRTGVGSPEFQLANGSTEERAALAASWLRLGAALIGMDPLVIEQEVHHALGGRTTEEQRERVVSELISGRVPTIG